MTDDAEEWERELAEVLARIGRMLDLVDALTTRIEGIEDRLPG